MFTTFSSFFMKSEFISSIMKTCEDRLSVLVDVVLCLTSTGTSLRLDIDIFLSFYPTPVFIYDSADCPFTAGVSELLCF